MTALETSQTLPAVPRHRPRRFRPQRLRAVVPVVIAGACVHVGVPGGWMLIAIGLLGGVMVWREDGLAPIDRWQALFPDVPFKLVERLPTGPRRSRFLEAVCDEVRATRGALREALQASRGTRRRALEPIERELAGLVALAADLSWQLERLDLTPAESAPRIARVEATLGDIVPAVQRLRATLLRASAGTDSDHRPRLGALLTLERDLTARQDCIDELEGL